MKFAIDSLVIDDQTLTFENPVTLAQVLRAVKKHWKEEGRPSRHPDFAVLQNEGSFYHINQGSISDSRKMNLGRFWVKFSPFYRKWQFGVTENRVVKCYEEFSNVMQAAEEALAWSLDDCYLDR